MLLNEGQGLFPAPTQQFPRPDETDRPSAAGSDEAGEREMWA